MESLHYKARPDRDDVAITADLTREEGRAQVVRIENLSADGCCVSGSFLIGEVVRLKVPGLDEFRAQIRWAMSGRSGLRFMRDEAN
jgi:hypothetical protein